MGPREKSEPDLSVNAEPADALEHRTVGSARTQDGLHAGSFLRGAANGFGMWREIRLGSRRWLASFQTARVVGWATAKWTADLSCCRDRLTSMDSRSHSVAADKLDQSLRAVLSLRRAIRALEQSSGLHSRVQGWASVPRRTIVASVFRMRGCVAVASPDITRCGGWRLRG